MTNDERTECGVRNAECGVFQWEGWVWIAVRGVTNDE